MKLTVAKHLTCFAVLYYKIGIVKMRRLAKSCYKKDKKQNEKEKILIAKLIR